MPPDVAMFISPKYKVADWVALGFRDEMDWQKAIAIFEDRIVGRFLGPVALVQDHDYSGFVVLAIDCLLIEALQQARRGVAVTPARQGAAFFQDFLTGTSFRTHFNMGTAGVFYKQIRCGVLHQAELKNTSKVRRVGALVKKTPDGNGLIINRKKFHRKLESVFRAYLRDLRRGADQQLRDNLKRKMDFICGI